MTYRTEIRRHYQTREEAYSYLASRGFLFLPDGWENGRWAALLEDDDYGFTVTIWLRAKAA